MSLSVTMLGTGAACPTVDRNVTAIAVHREGETVLFDCGEGTQRQMMRYGSGFGIREIFLTHYHADHILGLAGLIATFGLQDRREPLVIHGPRPGADVIATLVRLGAERPRFPVEIVEVQAGDILRRDGHEFRAFPVQHRRESIGWVLAEDERLGRFNPELARAQGIPEGPLWGRLHRGEAITLPDGRTVTSADFVGPTRPGRTLVFAGDSRPHADTVAASRGADLLIHEATFAHADLALARETNHSTAREAAEVAAAAGVRQLLLTHISARYSREAPELAGEAAGGAPVVQVARDGLSVELRHVDGSVDTGVNGG